MLQDFKDFLRKHELCRPGHRILLAVSGGIDSVVMMHLFLEAGYDCTVAHCNFQLRGEESDLDEAFVRSLGDSHAVPVLVRRFNVEAAMKEQQVSLQMAARNLRYEWFEHLLADQGLDRIATAHNRNDGIETFFLNLSRGSGIRGLTGIPPHRGRIIRPLLFAGRSHIEEYQAQQGLEFREDSSNLETKYQRNKIRHDVLPVMEQINPAFMEIMEGNMERMGEVLDIYERSVEQVRKELFIETQGTITLQLEKLRSLSPLRTWLYELFSPFGFTRMQCEEIEKIMDAGPGRQAVSSTHRLYKDREMMILVEEKDKGQERYYLEDPESPSFLPFELDMEILERSRLGDIPDDPRTACLDMDKLQFPLLIRRWQHGDYFYPLGMDQIKKLSDFFVDEKVPVPEKEKSWIMASGRKIVWIMGYRIDQRFRITSSTRRVLRLRFHADVAP